MTIIVTELNIYPFKSAKGISLNEMTISETGPQWDRTWMALTEKGQFISQRSHPQMALLGTELSENHLILSRPNGYDLLLPKKYSAQEGHRVAAKLFDDEIHGYSCGDQANQWISNFIGQPTQIVRHLPETKRVAPRKYTGELNIPVSFADGFPFLLTSNESLSELNQLLDKPITMNRFRPNIVVTGAKAGDEDSWKEFSIGDIPFLGLKDCRRCTVTTVDQTTGKRTGPEPLKSLGSYRLRDGKIVFGQNLAHLKTGKIKLHDKIQLKV